MTSLEKLYRQLRPYAFAIAYRMLGSVSEAEDVVQDAFVRLSTGAPDDIAAPKAYLATVTTRLAIDALRSAGHAVAAETADSLAMAFLVVLETLSPEERAAFLLHDVFDYGYDEIASIIGKSAANCRQLVSRTRRRVEERKPRFDTSREQRAELAARFFAACEGGDLDGLVSLLAGDAEFYGDGGEKGTGVKAPIFGRDAVARVLAGLFRRGRRLGAQMRRTEVNGMPGAMFFDADGGLINVLSLDIAEGTVQAVRIVVKSRQARAPRHALADRPARN